MTEWKDLKKEFPTDRSKLYLIKSVSVHPENPFVFYFLCAVQPCEWDQSILELIGHGVSGRRFRRTEHTKRDICAPDLFGAIDERPRVYWKEIEK